MLLIFGSLEDPDIIKLINAIDPDFMIEHMLASVGVLITLSISKRRAAKK